MSLQAHSWNSRLQPSGGEGSLAETLLISWESAEAWTRVTCGAQSGVAAVPGCAWRTLLTMKYWEQTFPGQTYGGRYVGTGPSDFESQVSHAVMRGYTLPRLGLSCSSNLACVQASPKDSVAQSPEGDPRHMSPRASPHQALRER